MAKEIASKDRLRKFLRDVYMKKEGAHDISTAIRDCLTDLFHISEAECFSLEDRLVDAEAVYIEEVTQAMQRIEKNNPK
jgi:hypothetical protein